MPTKAEYFEAAKREYEGVDIQIVSGPDDIVFTTEEEYTAQYFKREAELNSPV